jgi:hypothetical protein
MDEQDDIEAMLRQFMERELPGYSEGDSSIVGSVKVEGGYVDVMTTFVPDDN